jgi:hypothetical protein
MAHPERGPEAALELVEESTGRWVWRYVDPGEELVLDSNDTFGSRDEAEASATIAYPDVDLVRVRPLPPPAKGTSSGIDARREAVRLVALVGIAAMAAVAWRRLRR